MLRKDELRKLRRLNATPAIMREGKVQITTKRYYGTVQESKYSALCRAQQLGKVIKAAIFLPKDIQKGIETPRYEIFINAPGFQWITRELDSKGKEVRWTKAMLWNLPEVSFWDGNIYNTQDARRTFDKQLEGIGDYKGLQNKHGILRLHQWQKMIKAEQIRKKEKKETAPWDEDMKLIPKLPGGFKEWMRKDACKDFYIFYEYKKNGAKTGFCSRCRTEVPIKNPRHGEKATCPHCRAKATFRASGKIKTLGTEYYYGQIIQKITGGIVVKTLCQQQYYHGGPENPDYTKPHVITNELERFIILDSGKMKKYIYGQYKNKYTRWIYDGDGLSRGDYYTSYYWGSRITLYRRNFQGIIKTSRVFERSAIERWPKLPCGVVKYLITEKGNPAIEMLAKIGMFRLAETLLQMSYNSSLLDEGATEITKMLRIDTSRLKRLKAMDGDLKHLRWMQFEKLVDTIWPDEMILALGNNGIGPSDFGFIDPPVSYVKAYNYLIKQSAIMSETDLYQVLGTWRDYHNMASQMKMNTRLDQISRPKDLKKAHDELILLKEKKGIEKEATALRKKYPKVEKHLKNLEKFEYHAGDYLILAPKNIGDIVKEGMVLKHCVHTCDYYFSRIQTDESYLFFLRKATAPDMPWYTLEVEPSGNIRQKRTTGDNQNKDLEDAVKFLKQWQRYFVKRLTKKEKKLGERADVLRQENIAKLRAKDERIWHGKLAGKLLADVLEKDFMGIEKNS